jgi:hypothetical protein
MGALDGGDAAADAGEERLGRGWVAAAAVRTEKSSPAAMRNAW